MSSEYDFLNKIPEVILFARRQSEDTAKLFAVSERARGSNTPPLWGKLAKKKLSHTS